MKCYAKSLGVAALLFWGAIAPAIVRAEEPDLFHLAAHEILKKYVHAPDASYSWKLRQQARVGEHEICEIIMTSQTWRGIPWKHQLYILKPAKVTNTRAVLFIAGGSWRKQYEGPPQGLNLPSEVRLLAHVAQRLGSVIAVIKHVPHQPILGGMVEDQIISYTFDKFLTTGDTSWPLLRPMVKSAVRAMDTVQDHCKKRWNVSIDGFTVSGGSKRGWTTWLTSAVDPRVKALAPLVIDVLNMEEHLKLQLAAWGEFSEQIIDYTRRRIPQRMNTPLGKLLNAIVDPYHHRHFITQPKLIINGTNDRYWPLEALNLYWPHLQGPRWVLYVPNNGHGLKDVPRVVGAIAALHEHNTGSKPLPKMEWTWSRGEDGSWTIRLTADPAPETVRVWLARSNTMDFRPVRWTSRSLESSGKGQWTFTLRPDAEQYRAAFLEAQWQRPLLPLYLSTAIRVTRPAKAKGQVGSN